MTTHNMTTHNVRVRRSTGRYGFVQFDILPTSGCDFFVQCPGMEQFSAVTLEEARRTIKDHFEEK